MHDNDVSVKEWLITNLILCVPLVNIVMVFVWAFSSSEKPSKSNYFKAQLIFFLIIVALQILLFMTFGFSFLASLSRGYY